MSDDPKFAAPGSLDDLALLPGEFRAFRSEMRDAMESIARALLNLGRIEERIDSVAEQQRIDGAEIVDVKRRLAALETKKTRKKK